MKVYTSHLKSGTSPLLVREGFSWLAAFFGWIWLLAHRAWIQAALNFVLFVVLSRVARAIDSGWPLIGLFLLQGWLGRDVWRWSLAQRGYSAGPVVAAADEDAAFGRLLAEHPHLASAGA